jgi:hypothetical protein
MLRTALPGSSIKFEGMQPVPKNGRARVDSWLKLPRVALENRQRQREVPSHGYNTMVSDRIRTSAKVRGLD